MEGQRIGDRAPRDNTQATPPGIARMLRGAVGRAFLPDIKSSWEARSFRRNEDGVQIEIGLCAVQRWPGSAASRICLLGRCVAELRDAVNAVAIGADEGCAGPFDVAVVKQHILAIPIVVAAVDLPELGCG